MWSEYSESEGVSVVLGIVMMIHRYDDSSLFVASRRDSMLWGIVANDSLGVNRSYIPRLRFERIPGGEIEGLNWTEMFCHIPPADAVYIPICCWGRK